MFAGRVASHVDDFEATELWIGIFVPVRSANATVQSRHLEGLPV
jgi:hypothetical protein